MKAVMISIKPKWVEKIMNGEKTIEVRKTAPKLETPVKCYIYATKGGDRIVLKNDRVYELSKSLTGVVIGEFICDYIIKAERGHYIDLAGCKIDGVELLNYADGKPLYGWHISDLKIYDKPKEISEFFSGTGNAVNSKRIRFNFEFRRWEYSLTRPPQSWCYIEE